jgi:hypothetical protein
VLTAEWVRVRRREGELSVAPLSAPGRERAVKMAASMLAIIQAGAGRPREEILQSFEAIEVGVRERRIKGGLIKLICDRTEWHTAAAVDPETLRRDVFARATAARRDGAWKRDAVVGAASRQAGIEPDALERSLYADLSASQLLGRVQWAGPEELVAAYERGQAQAVLLRASDLTVHVRCASAQAARAFLHRLKFLQLLCTVETEPGGYRLSIDGPASLFESTARYGMKLAQLLPVLDRCDTWELVARVKWGKDRRWFTFRLSGQAAPGAGGDEPDLTDEARELLARWDEKETGWRVRPARAALTLAGAGISVPDLVFERGSDKVYLEIMGFWSRQAVFRRVDLVQKGLLEKVIIAVNRKLRVSEAVLGEHKSAALYVYGGTMSGRAIAERLDRLAGR